MNIQTTGSILPKAGKSFPTRGAKLMASVRECYLGAIQAAFSAGRGGQKMLQAAAEKDRKTAYNYQNGKSTMDAVTFIMTCLRCPHFVAELGERLRHIKAEDGSLARALVRRAKRAGGKFASMRLRFRRRKAVTP
ncbi:MAG: hypothetical protein ACLGJC_09500 [Alphaproteobacteria bacterium]